MPKYDACIAQDISEYGHIEFEARDDEHAIEIATKLARGVDIEDLTGRKLEHDVCWSDGRECGSSNQRVVDIQNALGDTIAEFINCED